MNIQELYQSIDGYLADLGCEEKSLIAVLQAIQEEYSYLPREIFPYLAKKMNLSEASIYGVATFYENFSLEAKGKYVIKVCDGTACHVRKSIPSRGVMNMASKARRFFSLSMRGCAGQST